MTGGSRRGEHHEDYLSNQFNSNDTNFLQKKLADLESELLELENEAENLDAERDEMLEQNSRIKEQNKRLFSKITSHQSGNGDVLQ